MSFKGKDALLAKMDQYNLRRVQLQCRKSATEGVFASSSWAEKGHAWAGQVGQQQWQYLSEDDSSCQQVNQQQ